MFLVEAKRQSADKDLISYIPEAVGQAIVLKSAKCVSASCLIFLHPSIDCLPASQKSVSVYLMGRHGFLYPQVDNGDTDVL